jgi:hypothetical protein
MEKPMNPDRFEKSGTPVCKRQGRPPANSWNPKSRLAARHQAGTDLRAVRENEPRMTSR